MWLIDKVFKSIKKDKIAAQYAPYNKDIYERAIVTLKSADNVKFTPFNDYHTHPESNVTSLYFRHDIDTLDCVNNLSSLIEIDRRYGIIPGIFFIVNDEPYSLASCKDLAALSRDLGYPVGLHTVCYLSDDYLGAFQQEISQFTSTFGFKPDTFNTHGLGSLRLDTRLKFYDEISVRYQEFGFQYSDCCAKLREYRYIYEDCHWDKDRASRYLKKDFFDPLSSLANGNALVLTHPCYWTF